MKAILLCLLPVWRGREKGAAYGVPRQSSPSKVRKNWNETTTPNPRKGLLVPSLYPRKKSTKDATVPLTVHGPQGCLQMLETNLRKLDGPKVKKSSAEESRSNASPLQTPGIRGRGAPSADAEAPELPGPLHSGAAVCAPRSRVFGTRRPPLAGSHGSDRMNRQQRLRGERQAGRQSDRRRSSCPLLDRRPNAGELPPTETARQAQPPNAGAPRAAPAAGRRARGTPRAARTTRPREPRGKLKSTRRNHSSRRRAAGLQPRAPETQRRGRTRRRTRGGHGGARARQGHARPAPKQLQEGPRRGPVRPNTRPPRGELWAGRGANTARGAPPDSRGTPPALTAEARPWTPRHGTGVWGAPAGATSRAGVRQLALRRPGLGGQGRGRAASAEAAHPRPPPTSGTPRAAAAGAGPRRPRRGPRPGAAPRPWWPRPERRAASRAAPHPPRPCRS